MSSVDDKLSGADGKSSIDKINDVNLGKIFVQCALVIAVFVTSLLILISIWVDGRLRRNIYGQLLSSLAFSGIFFGLFIRPATIQMDIGGINEDYCSFYLFFVKTEWIFLPYVLWIISIERLIALNQPENYLKHFGPISKRAILLAAPWIIGITFATCSTFLPGTNIKVRSGSNHPSTISDGNGIDKNFCYAEYSPPAFQIVHSLWLTIAVMIPIISLAITSAALVIVYMRRSGVTVKCDDVPLVENGSIIYSTLLNISVLVVLLIEAVVLFKGFETLVSDVYSHWYGGILELTAGVIGLVTLPDIRRGLFKICGSGCCGRKEEENIPLTPKWKPDEPK